MSGALLINFFLLMENLPRQKIILIHPTYIMTEKQAFDHKSIKGLELHGQVEIKVYKLCCYNSLLLSDLTQ